MKTQTIPIHDSSTVIDDTLIRIVNENHDRHVRQQQERLERQEMERQLRKQKLCQFLDGLICAAIGAAATLTLLAFML